MKRVSGCLFLIGLIACGFASMRAPSEALFDVMRLGVYTLLVVATVLAVTKKRMGSGWAGFALCGWAYFLPIYFGSPQVVSRIPTNFLVSSYANLLFPKFAAPVGIRIAPATGNRPRFTLTHDEMPTASDPLKAFQILNFYNQAASLSARIGHLWINLCLAALGFMIDRRWRPGSRVESHPRPRLQT